MNDATDPAEERALQLMLLLHEDRPRPSDTLRERIMRTARWQYALRGVLHVLAQLAGALGDLTRLVLGGGSQRRELGR